MNKQRILAAITGTTVGTTDGVLSMRLWEHGHYVLGPLLLAALVVPCAVAVLLLSRSIRKLDVQIAAYDAAHSSPAHSSFVGHQKEGAA